jgi:hypothetical protein
MFASAEDFPTSLVSLVVETTWSVVAVCPGRRAESASSLSLDKTTSAITSGKAPCSQQTWMIIIKESFNRKQITSYLWRGIVTAKRFGDLIPQIDQWLIEHQLHSGSNLFCE